MAGTPSPHNLGTDYGDASTGNGGRQTVPYASREEGPRIGTPTLKVRVKLGHSHVKKVNARTEPGHRFGQGG